MKLSAKLHHKGYPSGGVGRNEFWRLVDKKAAPGRHRLNDAPSPSSTTTTPARRNHTGPSRPTRWAGNAYIDPSGAPSVFWDHYFDCGDLKDKIKVLLRARDDAGIHSRSAEIVAATDQVAALVGDRLAVKLGHDGQALKAVATGGVRRHVVRGTKPSEAGRRARGGKFGRRSTSGVRKR